MNILIENWKSDERNTRQGYVSITLPDYGLTIRDCVLHLSHGKHWLAFPAREYTNREGEKKWWAHISFADRSQGDAFQQAAIAALRRHSPEAFGGAAAPAPAHSLAAAAMARRTDLPNRPSPRAVQRAAGAQAPLGERKQEDLDDPLPF